MRFPFRSQNTQNNTISIKKVELYIIGDGGPNGWNIGSPSAMTYSNGSFVYTGALNSGEFKIAKFKGDWCDGDWINAATANQNITDGNYIITHGCDGPDNKWKRLVLLKSSFRLPSKLNSTILSLKIRSRISLTEFAKPNP